MTSSDTNTISVDLLDQPEYEGKVPPGAIAMFLGDPIYPFTLERQETLQLIGCGLFDAENYEARESDGETALYLKLDYKGIMRDQKMLVFLCTCPDDDLIFVQSCADTIRKAANLWAKEKGFSYGNERWMQLKEVFMLLIEGALGESQPEPSISGS